jgi:hypothetical protein
MMLTGSGLSTWGGAKTKAFRWIVRGGRAATVGGAATSEFGVGLVILAAGLILEFVGTKLLEGASLSAVEKALYHSRFGKSFDLTTWMKLGYWRSSTTRALNDVRTLPAAIELHDATQDLHELYCALHEYDLTVKLYREYESGLPKDFSTGSYVVMGEVRFKHFMPEISGFEIDVKMRPYMKTIAEVSYPRLKTQPIVEDGRLVGLKFGHRAAWTPGGGVPQEHEVTVRSRLDIEGDGSYFVPRVPPTAVKEHQQHPTGEAPKPTLQKTEFDHSERGSSFDGPLPGIYRSEVDRFLNEDTSPQAKEKARREAQAQLYEAFPPKFPLR